MKVQCGSVVASRDGAAREGERIVLELRVPAGNWECKGTLEGVFSDGSEGQMPLKFQVNVVGGMKITVPRETLDLANRRLEVILDRPGKMVETTVFGDAGRQVGQGITPIEGTPANKPAMVEWAQEPVDVFHIHLKATDVDGIWTGIDLFPWSYNIPHEDVEFESAMAEIRASEEAKLTAALQEARSTLARFTFVDIPMNLYVAGYTDSVGDQAYNQGLSQRRAEAIAKWFRANGFTEPIWYQGFGEDGQKVETADEVDEAKNRRAQYVLAAEAPPVSADFPGGAWKKLP